MQAPGLIVSFPMRTCVAYYCVSLATQRPDHRHDTLRPGDDSPEDSSPVPVPLEDPVPRCQRRCLVSLLDMSRSGTYVGTTDQKKNILPKSAFCSDIVLQMM